MPLGRRCRLRAREIFLEECNLDTTGLARPSGSPLPPADGVATLPCFVPLRSDGGLRESPFRGIASVALPTW